MVEFTDLHEELMVNILLRLPAKPLIQLKSVCRSWYHLISSPQFAQLHLDQTLTLPLTKNPNLQFIFSSPNLSSAHFDTFERITELDHPFRNIGEGWVDVVGSCHGLLCLCNNDSHLTIYLYNPTTRTHKKLPFLPLPSDFLHSVSFGFGYDDVSMDYKFVRILHSDSEQASDCVWSQVMVYSLRTNSWSRVGNVPHPFSPRRNVGVLVNGTLHWTVEVFDGVRRLDSIVSFSLSSHKFGKVAGPNYEDESVGLQIGVLDECLCLLTNDTNHTDIWVMKEYGVVGSWTRLFKVPLEDESLNFEWPIAFSLNSRELYLQLVTWRVVALDLESMVYRNIQFGDFSRCFDSQVCLDNLMMLKDDAAVEIPEIDHKRGKKRRWTMSQRQERKKAKSERDE